MPTDITKVVGALIITIIMMLVVAEAFGFATIPDGRLMPLISAAVALLLGYDIWPLSGKRSEPIPPTLTAVRPELYDTLINDTESDDSTNKDTQNDSDS